MTYAQETSILSNSQENPNLETQITLCRKGLHDLTLPNAYTYNHRCRMCHRITDAQYHSRRRETEDRSVEYYREYKGDLRQRILRKMAQLTHLERLINRD